jgi:hypothetical protein
VIETARKSVSSMTVALQAAFSATPGRDLRRLSKRYGHDVED